MSNRCAVDIGALQTRWGALPVARRSYVDVGGLQQSIPDTADALANIKQDLKAFLRFNESSGARADSHGENHTTNSSGSPGRAATKTGYGLDCSPGSSQWVSIPDSADVSIGDADCTVAVLVRLKSAVSGAWCALAKGDGTSAEYFFQLGQSGVTGWAFNVASGASFGGHTRVATGDIGDHSFTGWILLIGLHDAAADTITLKRYAGRGTVTQSTSHAGGIYDGSAPLYFGSYPAFSQHADVVIDWGAVWKRKLTDAECDGLWNNGNQVDYIDLLPFFDNFEAPNQYLSDYSPFWVDQNAGSDRLRVSSSRVGAGPAFADVCSYYAGLPFESNHSCRGTISGASHNYAGLGVRLNGRVADDNAQGYVWYPSLGIVYALTTGGTFVSFETGWTTATVGDVCDFVAEDDELRGYINGALAGSAPVPAAPYEFTGGYPGIAISGANGAAIENFWANNGTNPIGPAEEGADIPVGVGALAFAGLVASLRYTINMPDEL